MNFWRDASTATIKSVTYTPALPAAGRYEVKMWWRAYSTYAEAVLVDIHHSGTTDTVTINQQINGSQWNTLGTYEFTGNDTEYVKIRNDDGAGNRTTGNVVADAVRFAKVKARSLTTLDNSITNVSSNAADAPGVTWEGFWANKSYAGYYGANCWTDNMTVKGTKHVTYTPVLPESGTYYVQAWWSNTVSTATYATHVPIDICHSGTTDTVIVNQQENGNRWNTLGTYEFTSDGGEYVKIRNDGSVVDIEHVIADAVRFVPKEIPPYAAPVFLLHPDAGAGVTIGSQIVLTAHAFGNPEPLYQWQVKEGSGESWRDLAGGETIYSGVTTGTLTIASVAAGMDGWQYRLGANDGIGSAVYSNSAVLVILASLPSIEENPVAEQPVPVGGTLDIRTVVSSDIPVTYQWQVKEGASADWRDLTAADINYSGITTDTLSILSTTAGMDGWQYRLVATTDAGSSLGGITTIKTMPDHFLAPIALAFDTGGNMYVADSGNNKIFQVGSSGKANVFAGSGSAGLVNGTGTAARFSAPRGLAVHSSTLLVADSGNSALRGITISASTSTLLGASAGLVSPAGVAVDSTGNLYIADEANHVIRVVTSGNVAGATHLNFYR